MIQEGASINSGNGYALSLSVVQTLGYQCLIGGAVKRIKSGSSSKQRRCKTFGDEEEESPEKEDECRYESDAGYSQLASVMNDMEKEWKTLCSR